MAENQQGQSSIISAIHRLERAGSEHSASTAKLLRAAATLSDAIMPLLPQEHNSYPRGYRVAIRDTDRSHGGRECMGVLYYTNGDEACNMVDEARASALGFAEDLADGWLDELATWLEARSAQDSVAVATLERAAAGLREEVQP